jgi:hypothetical protein
MILYCFISHSSAVENDFYRISSMMSNFFCEYKIFYGGNKKILENEYVKHINCDDTYIGLPDKINKMCKYLSTINNIDYIVKLDRSIEITNTIDKAHMFDSGKVKSLASALIARKDYIGITRRFKDTDRDTIFHFKRTPIYSKWHNKPFDAPIIPYCNGGNGYILSKKCVDIISNDNSQENFPIEDYYVGYILYHHQDRILPTRANLHPFFYDNKKLDDKNYY